LKKKKLSCDCVYGEIFYENRIISLIDLFFESIKEGDQGKLDLFWENYDGPIRSGNIVLFVIRSKPDDSLFLAGDFNSWDETQKMDIIPFDNTFRYRSIEVKHNEFIYYKFKNNRWFSDPYNKYFLFNPKFNNSVVYPENGGRITQITIPSPKLNNNNRNIYIYLPAEYFHSNRKYPVVYMQDGDNLFENSPKAKWGTWNIRKNVDSIVESSLAKPFIVAGITTSNRDDEYLHGSKIWGEKQVAKLDLYTEYLIQTLIPAVESQFRVEKNPENRAIAGSSFGGISIFRIAWLNSDIFGKLASFSPSSWIGEEPDTIENESMLELISETQNMPELKIYLDSGDLDAQGIVSYIADSRVYTDHVRNLLITKGWDGREEWLDKGQIKSVDYPADSDVAQVPTLYWSQKVPEGYKDHFDYLKTNNNLLHLVGENHNHNEAAWSKRVNSAFVFLFPESPRYS
jgi:predicted alpha/beta superfamily hydrolase